MIGDPTIFRLLAEALALGLLVGAERYRGREPGERKSAGVRTFAIFCLLGALCGIFASVGITIATFAAIAALVLLGYYRSPAGSLGLTTEVAALLIFWIGYLLSTHEPAAISLGIVVTIFLASKRTLHDFVREKVSEVEFEATLKFLAVVLVIYPVLPDRQMGPYGFFNPRQLWGLVILVSTISFLGYVLIRWLGDRRGLMLGALAGGIVSTPAVTMSLAERSRSAPESSRLMGTAAVLANAVQGPRLLVLLWVVNRDLAQTLAVPLLGMAAVGFAGAWLLARRAEGDPEIDLHLRNPYSLRPALKFGLFFLAVLLVVRLASLWLGERGVLVASAISGTFSASAVTLSVSKLVEQVSLTPLVAASAIILAIATNALAKWLLAMVHGTSRMAFWLGGGLLTMVGTACLLLFLGF